MSFFLPHFILVIVSLKRVKSLKIPWAVELLRVLGAKSDQDFLQGYCRARRPIYRAVGSQEKVHKRIPFCEPLSVGGNRQEGQEVH